MDRRCPVKSQEKRNYRSLLLKDLLQKFDLL